MTLLHRIAISKGNEQRRALANQVIAGLEQDMVTRWNRSLQEEIYAKAGGGLSGRMVAARLVASDGGPVPFMV